MAASAFVAHLLALLAPAWGVAVLSTGLARLVFRRRQWRMRWWVCALAGGLLGSTVLLAGLVWTGEDGRMATYTALIAVQALLLSLVIQRPSPQ